MTFCKRVIDGQLVDLRLGRVTAEGVDYGYGVAPQEVNLRLHKVGAYGLPRPTRLRAHKVFAFAENYVPPPDPEPEPEVFLRAHQVGPITV